MTFWRLSTILRPFARAPDLVIDRRLWRELVGGLRTRGRNVRESGAFLLGPEGAVRRVTRIVFYDQIDSRAFDTGIIVIDGGKLGALWSICQAEGLTVVADVHTHPGGAWQSDSDRRHPMIAKPGHLSMIIPDFARDPIELRNVGLYRYLGSYKWQTLKPSFFHPSLLID